MNTLLKYIILSCNLICLTASLFASSSIEPVIQTLPVRHDADDPAIWINKKMPEKSIIVGTDKGDKQNGSNSGGLYVFNLKGEITQAILGLARPNNVDIEYGFKHNGKQIDIAVCTEREKNRLRIFQISDGKLKDIQPNGIPVFEGETGDNALPMGIALYKRSKDGALFAIVSRKTGASGSYLWQYHIVESKGRIIGKCVRKFGTFSGAGEIEAVCVDDAEGIVYYAEEDCCLRQYWADPANPNADKELLSFGKNEYIGDREGIAVAVNSSNEKFIISADQIKNGSILYLYKSGDKKSCLKQITTLSDSTDGIETAATPLGAQFPKGILVMMNSKDRNFHIYSLADILP